MKVILIIFFLFSTGYCKIEFGDRARNFSVELLYFTAEETNWHTVISPFGVWSLLTAVSLGASGSSREQLITTLILPKRKNKLIKAYKSLTLAVLRSNTDAVKLKNRNFLFDDVDLIMKPDFIRDIRDNFKTIPIKIDFNPPELAAKIANKVIQRYGMAVTNVLTFEDFENSKIILTNVITFKGIWHRSFDVSLTKVAPFYDETGKEIGEVNMMNQEGNFLYSIFEEIQATILEIPYGNHENAKYTFIAILPDKGVKASTVYQHLSNVNLKDILFKLQNNTDKYKTVQVNLPRFQISTNAVLNRPLNQMGLYDIFDPSTANFEKITKAQDIFVSSIIHKADIEVTETGAIPSASSTVSIAVRFLPPNFNANRPFIYFILEKTTNTIIFSGIYSKPSIF